MIENFLKMIAIKLCARHLYALKILGDSDLHYTPFKILAWAMKISSFVGDPQSSMDLDPLLESGLDDLAEIAFDSVPPESSILSPRHSSDIEVDIDDSFEAPGTKFH